MKKIVLLMNPHSRSGIAAETALAQALLDAQHIILNPLPLEEKADFNELILKHEKEADLVVIGGGDGSVNHALKALVQTKLPLLVFPQGTANNLARTYQIPADILSLVSVIETGKTICIDLGSANDIYFVNVAGLGLSTEVNRSVSSQAKRWFGVGAFIAAAIRTFLRTRPFHAVLKTTESGVEKCMEVKTWQISVCNGKYYGSGLVIHADANLSDQKLHLLSTEVKSSWEGFRLIPSLRSGKFTPEQHVTLISHSEIKITTHRPRSIDLDGDIKTKTPAHFKVHPQVLNLLVP